MTNQDIEFLQPLLSRFHVRGPAELLDLAVQFFAEEFVQGRVEQALFYARCAAELVRLAALSP